MRTVLEKIERMELLNFLVEYAAGDTRFADAIRVRFCVPEFDEELIKMKSKIAFALEGAEDYRRCGSWGYISVDTGDIVAEIMQRAEQGHIKLAFVQMEALYRPLLGNFEYQAECEISDEAEFCLERMLEIADKAVFEEGKQYIFGECLELCKLEDGKDYGADYEDKLLGIAVRFVTPENRADFERELVRFDSQWRAEEFALLRLELIRKLDTPNTTIKTNRSCIG